MAALQEPNPPPERGGHDSVSIGSRVIDSDDDDPDPAVVVNLPPVPASAWDLPALGATVAEENPQYPSDADVAVVVFEHALVNSRPEYEGDDPIPIKEIDAPWYAFPEPRLAVIGTFGEEPEPEPEPEPTTALQAIAERLRAGGMSIEIVEDDRLRASKLGQEYEVTDAGTVVGDGALRDRLREAISEVMTA